MRSYDAIVVGLGGMGSAALWHLARRGLRVLGIEQFDVGHDRGSSHGGSRLIRKAYFEHPGYVPLVSRAYELWNELAEASGRPLFHRSGLLLAGAEQSATIRGVRLAASTHRLKIEDVPNTDCPRRFPGLVPSKDMVVLFEPDAGFLAVEDCVKAHVQQAVVEGATVLTGETVRKWMIEGQDVSVYTDRGRHVGKRLVLCGGAWSGEWLSSIGWPLEIRRKVVVWFETVPGAYEFQRGCPVFCFDTSGGFFYGFPSMEGRGVKVGEHSGGTVVERPENMDRSLQVDDLDPLRKFIGRHLPDAKPSVVSFSVCMYTMTPDEHFIVDRHPDNPQVFAACGFSGHGFKFASVIGKALADLVIEGRTAEPIQFLQGNRFPASR